MNTIQSYVIAMTVFYIYDHLDSASSSSSVHKIKKRDIFQNPFSHAENVYLNTDVSFRQKCTPSVKGIFGTTDSKRQSIFKLTYGFVTTKHRPFHSFCKDVRVLTFRRLTSYIYIYMEHPFLMFLDHTQRRSTVGRTPLDE